MKYIYILFILFLFAFFPTSLDGEIPDTSRVIFDWIIVSCTLILFLFFSNLIKRNLIVLILVVFFMTIDTLIIKIIDYNSRISIARIAPILIPSILFSFDLKYKLNIKVLKFFFEFILLIIIFWNILILTGNEWISINTIKYYSQLYPTATSNAIFFRKPVFTFSLNTFSSFFYVGLFYLTTRFYKVTNCYRFRIYQVFIIFFNLMLFSNTSIFFSFVLLYLFIKQSKNKIAIIIILGILFICAFIIANLIFENGFLEKYLFVIQSEKNGFLGRYLAENNSLESNLKYVSEKYFIGFTIIDNFDLTYTDSGYVLYYTMGGLTLVFLMYYSLINFLKLNLKKEDFLFSLFLILIFEIALPIIIYYKFFYFIIFYIITLKNLNAKESEG